MVVLCLMSGPALMAKDLDFTTSQPCNSTEQEYEINYDNAGNLEWIIEGGEIIKFANDNTPQGLSQSYMGTQYYPSPYSSNNIYWLNTLNYTRYKFSGLSNVEATFLNPYTNQQMNAQNLSNNGTPDFNNPLKKITVRWYPGYTGQRKITCIGRSLGFLGNEVGNTTKYINFPASIPTNFVLTASATNAFCNQGVTISGGPANGVNYNWNTNGGVIQNSWNGGISISRFTNDGIVPITLTASNECYSVTKTVTLNIAQPDFGHVTQNNVNVDVPGSLVTLDCDGKFSVSMPVYVSNSAVYTWELPGTSYDAQTNTYTKTIVSGVNKQSVQGQLPVQGLTDFVGKVTITGVCGAPVVKTFIIRPALRPTVDPEIYSCSNSVEIKVNNPTGTSNINTWVRYSTPLGLQSTITNQTPTSALFTSASPGTYYIAIGVNGAGGCYTELQSTVRTGTAGYNPTANTAGWQSGVLSDNRKAVGSNIVAYGGNIYFSGRDGKIYYYSFSTASQKWIINEIPGITNALKPVGGAFTKIGFAALNGVSYLFYTENAANKLWKIDLATNVVSDGLFPSVNASDFIAEGNEVYAIKKETNELVSNLGSINNNLGIAILKTIIPGYGITYVQNNNLYSTAFGQLTSTADIYTSSDVVYYNGWLYYARGQKGNANLYRMQLTNPSAAQQITTSSNLSGVFNINPVSGVIYYGILNLGVANNITTQTSGLYKAGDVYQAHLSGTAWVLNKATTVVNYEGLDMLIHSPVYSGNHLYYVGAGHNTATGGTIRELEVWNLYYENDCAPVLQREGLDTDATAESVDVLMYPNPFNTELAIDLSSYSEQGNTTSVSVEIIDATGKSIYKSTLPSELASITSADWSAGIYIVKITYNDKRISKKVVKY
ncbi:T9SS type A sorting domain-containing protein [Cytophaga hutchinsonii]|nr:T9SS type A sorting domain-containing protein [Cytophaga hutchinsonii]